MKGGASPTDVRNITKYFEAGHKAEAIAQSMNLPLACVQSFMRENLIIAKDKVRKAEEADSKKHKAKKDAIAKGKAEAKDI